MLELHLQTLDVVRMYGIGFFHALLVTLFFRLCCPFFGIFPDELFDTSRRINDLLASREERMALRTEIYRNFLNSRACLDLVTACAGNDA